MGVVGRAARWLLVGAVVFGVWWNRAALTGVVRAVGDGRLVELGRWWPLLPLVVFLVVVYLWDVWRRPDKPCWACSGVGRVFGVSWLLRRRVSGTCRWCGGDRWYARRVARVLGWSSNSGVRW